VSSQKWRHQCCKISIKTSTGAIPPRSLRARYILKELDRTHGNISRAAEALGLERSHLYRKMKALGIHLGE